MLYYIYSLLKVTCTQTLREMNELINSNPHFFLSYLRSNPSTIPFELFLPNTSKINPFFSHTR